MLPGRPRSYRQLAYHIFQIPEVFLERVENDAPYTYEALISQLPPDLTTHAELSAYAVRCSTAGAGGPPGGTPTSING
ncbi:MAG: hypothetical protein CM1200mP20_14420 [Pseudomonadota bacterium]|nr:MAG: hypothetical protein CM1200mP20_14420 [Pseudomonadota bacterium]